jgi:hypothetical protein
MAKKNDIGFWIDKKGDAVHEGNVKATEKIKDELVEKLISKACNARDTIFEFKANAFGEVEDYYNLLLQEFGVDEKRNSKKGNLTIENFSGTAKIAISVADRIAFDEKLGIAKIKIDEYLHEITKDANADIQTLITKAFEVDKKGDVNAKKILSLKSYEITHPLWIEAIEIISQATEVVSSKSYIRFYTRENIDEEYKQIPLDIAGV